MMGLKGKCRVCKPGWNYQAFYLTYTNTNCCPYSGQRHHVVSGLPRLRTIMLLPPSGMNMEAGSSSKTVVNPQQGTWCRNQGLNPKFDRREYSVPNAQKTQIYSITKTICYLRERRLLVRTVRKTYTIRENATLLCQTRRYME